MNEKEIRQKAMLRYDQGEKAKDIYTSYNKSERWFFKWLKRYKSGEPNWADEQSRKPHKTVQIRSTLQWNKLSSQQENNWSIRSMLQ